MENWVIALIAFVVVVVILLINELAKMKFLGLWVSPLNGKIMLERDGLFGIKSIDYTFKEVADNYYKIVATPKNGKTRFSWTPIFGYSKFDIERGNKVVGTMKLYIKNNNLFTTYTPTDGSKVKDDKYYPANLSK